MPILKARRGRSKRHPPTSNVRSPRSTLQCCGVQRSRAAGSRGATRVSCSLYTRWATARAGRCRVFALCLGISGQNAPPDLGPDTVRIGGDDAKQLGEAMLISSLQGDASDLCKAPLGRDKQQML